MKVRSPVGEFPFKLNSVSVDGVGLRIEGAMGAWPTVMEMEPRDILDVALLVKWPLLLVVTASVIHVLSRSRRLKTG